MTNAPAEVGAPTSARRRRMPIIAEVLLALVTVALVQAFVVKPFGVPSQSMEQTLQIGDRLLVNRLDPVIERQDVVVFGHGITWSDRELPPADGALSQFARNVGDIIGFGPSNTAYTGKRVIGMPGEKVNCCSVDGKVQIDGVPLTEDYIYEDLPFAPGTLDCTTSPRSPRCFPEITVPAEHYLVMGDHRSESADSVIACRGSTAATSCARFVPADRIVGPVLATFWPLNRLGGIPR